MIWLNKVSNARFQTELSLDIVLAYLALFARQHTAFVVACGISVPQGTQVSRASHLDATTICRYNPCLRYEWDETKRRINLQQHGIDFADIPNLFIDEIVVLEDDGYDYGESRFLAFGLLAGCLIAVAYTERSEDVIQLISARKANKHETDQYYDQITN